MIRIHIISTPQRPKPKAGDRRTTKAHGLQIRVQDMATDIHGKPVGRVVRGSRPAFSWVKPQHLKPWDRHHLTAEEMARYFPPPFPVEGASGYMQQRGSA